MKIRIVFIILSTIFTHLIADSMIDENDIIANIPLKDNQVLLFDGRTQKAVGIIEMTSSGKIIRIPLPKNSKNKDSSQNLTNMPLKEDLLGKKQNIKNRPNALPQTSSQEPLINKNKQWNKKKIPYLIKEETIPNEEN
ncbi:hypothetical protein BKH42_05870 [Helicobacter sp. 13S00482-2]|uniref:hypothetical protein n=1 Tax=Helicobacter sp. 13S00482-2 TaxID=1476200 RepID=UPI000BA6462A|nr:hypothetical protein [Helicobacter sp. 13S00482-2]PAF53450.1 hypothetical protein BKH42_05870 [Helicobacter sp. 13S00482-2]